MSEPAEILALVDKHTPAALFAPGVLSPGRVRTLMRDLRPRSKRTRRRNTPRGRMYGWLKIAAANIPPHGVVVANATMAEGLRVVGRRMGIKLCVQRVGNGPARLVTPALTGAELSHLSSQL